VNRNTKNILLVAGIVLMLYAFFNLLEGGAGSQPSMPFSDFLARVEEGKVADVKIREDLIYGHFADGGVGFITRMPPNTNVVDRLLDKGVKIDVLADTSRDPTFLGVLISILASPTPAFNLEVVVHVVVIEKGAPAVRVPILALNAG